MGFIEDNFVQPLIQNGWFNPYNTALYGAILIVGFILVYKLLERLKINIDRKLMLAILPFVVWAPVTRAIRDLVYTKIPVEISSNPLFGKDLFYNYGAVYTQSHSHISSSLPMPFIPEIYSAIISWFVTPGSYLITAGLAVLALLASYAIQKKTSIPYWKPMFAISFLILVGSLLSLPIKTLYPLALILPTAVGLTAIFYGISYFARNNPKLKAIFNFQSSSILGAHFVDASATFWALTSYGFVEQHVVPRLFFGSLGTVSFFFLKPIVVIPVLWVFNKEIESVRLRNLLKIAVIILGLAPGLRDMITLLLVG